MIAAQFLKQLQLARSFLFVPGDRPERYAKAQASGADAVIIDLEDAVASEAKATARAAAYEYLSHGGQALVRINALETAWVQDDLLMCAEANVLGVICPKTEHQAGLEHISSGLRNGTVLLPLIETAKGLCAVHDIASANLVGRLLFGSVDLSLDLSIEPSEDEAELTSYRAMLVMASRAAGLASPIDGVTLNLHDDSALLSATQKARRTGFGAKLCLHPAQIATVHRAFAYSAEETAWALRLIAAAQDQAGAFQFEGRMVDAPVLMRAKRIAELSGCASIPDSQ